MTCPGTESSYPRRPQSLNHSPVSSTAARGPGTVCAGDQREPAQGESLGAQPSQEGTQPYSLQTHIHSSSARCAHVKRSTRVQLPALKFAIARFIPGRGTAFLTNPGDRYKRHAVRIDMVSATSAATFTQISAGTRVSATEHLHRAYPRI